MEHARVHMLLHLNFLLREHIGDAQYRNRERTVVENEQSSGPQATVHRIYKEGESRNDLPLQRPSSRSRSTMALLKTIFSILLATSATLAALPSGTVTCGNNRYSVSAITAAINAGVKDMQSGNFPGMH